MFKISTGPELAHQPMAISPSLSSRKKKIFTFLHTFIRLVELCLIKNTYIHPVSFFLIICESFLTFILRKKFSSKISSSLKYYFFLSVTRSGATPTSWCVSWRWAWRAASPGWSTSTTTSRKHVPINKTDNNCIVVDVWYSPWKCFGSFWMLSFSIVDVVYVVVVFVDGFAIINDVDRTVIVNSGKTSTRLSTRQPWSNLSSDSTRLGR